MERDGPLGVVGTGLIGTSIGLAARAAGLSTLGWDQDSARLQAAAERGAFEPASDFHALLTRSRIVALAVPVTTIVQLLERFRRTPPPASLVFDVGSVKAPIVAAAEGFAPFAGTHPIAGASTGGPAGAAADLFRDRVWVVDTSAAPDARARVTALVEAFGARPIPMNAAVHDRAIARTSHLPQLVATALASLLEESLADPATCALCGPGIRSMTRLGSSPWSMWEGIFSYNGPPVAQEVRGLVHILSEAAAALEAGDPSALAPRFRAAAEAVRRLAEPSTPELEEK